MHTYLMNTVFSTMCGLTKCVLQICFSVSRHRFSGMSFGTETFTVLQCCCGCKSHNSIGCSTEDTAVSSLHSSGPTINICITCRYYCKRYILYFLCSKLCAIFCIFRLFFAKQASPKYFSVPLTSKKHCIY